MPAKDLKLPVLITEVCWNENVAERFGKIGLQNLLLKAMNIATNIVKEHSGKIVQAGEKNIFCTFPNAKKAIQAACTQHRSLKNQLPQSKLQVSLKTGLHYGVVKISKDGVSGESVSIGRKIQRVATASQILLSKDMMEEIPTALNIQFQSKGKLKAKERFQKIKIFEAFWMENEEEHTVFIENDIKRNSTEAVLILKYQGKKYKLNKSRTSFRIGRSNENDIIIDDASISRSHALVRYVNGKFKITDQSTNGTYLQTAAKQDHFLHNSDFLLMVKGVFCPGSEIKKGDPYLIYYSVLNK